MFSTNIEKLTKQVGNLPVGVAEGLHWLLSQEDWFVKDIAKQLLEPNEPVIADLRTALQHESEKISLWSFKDHLIQYIKMTGQSLFKNPNIAIDPESIKISVGTDFNKACTYLNWTLCTGNLPYDTQMQMTINGDTPLHAVIEEMKSTSIRRLQYLLHESWALTLLDHKTVPKKLREQIEAYHDIFKSAQMRAEDGMVINTPYRVPIVIQFEGDVWTEVGGDHNIYKRYELAIALES